MTPIDYTDLLTRLESGQYDKSLAHNAATQVATFGGAKVALATRRGDAALGARASDDGPPATDNTDKTDQTNQSGQTD
ncbi:MAG: hypothetical protein FJ137_10900 [Deltaproteobacteria bacterium]|nr:hypothetical protein [Deltaproteobacteria bacterium]